MKTKITVISLLLGTVLLCAPIIAKAKSSKKSDKAASGTAAPAVDPAMMEKWKAYSTPGAAHQALSPLAGSFTHEIKSWMTADAKPEVTIGTSDGQWILGGRFLETVVKGTSMGQPFEGRSTIGYDNEKKQYDSVWIDNMGTGIMISHGQYDAASKTLSESGTASCPMEGTKMFRGVTKLIDNNTHTYELYTNDKDGKEFRTMEITYVRKSS